ncbi:enoyl-CoA hydratase/carnithine racemase [Bradyrhizobium japonicum]
MTYRSVNYEKRGHLAVITINRPHVLNALHTEAQVELKEIYEDFRDDPNLRVAILTGAGNRAFSAGNDLKAIATGDSNGVDGIGPPTHLVSTKPMIAAVNGVAAGGGFEMALACDIIIAAEHARFGLAEPRVGRLAADGGFQRLARQVPYRLAMGLILTGKLISATEAYRIGLANEVVPLADLMATAERWAQEILECSPVSLRLAKESLLAGEGLSVNEAIEQDYRDRLPQLLASPDSLEGPRAFAEKRKPQWA